MDLFKNLKRHKSFKTVRSSFDKSNNVIILEHVFNNIIALASYVHSLKSHVDVTILSQNNRILYFGTAGDFQKHTPDKINREIYSEIPSFI